MNASQIVTSLLLGLSLSMDADCVSAVYGLKYTKVKITKILFATLLFGIMQGLMPVVGYFVSYSLTMTNYKDFFVTLIPYIGFLILFFLGYNMFFSNKIVVKDEIGLKRNVSHKKNVDLTYKEIILASIGTSIDALTVGIGFGNESVSVAMLTFLIVCILTFVLSFLSFLLGKKIGVYIEKYALLVGGIILICIGFKLILFP